MAMIQEVLGPMTVLRNCTHFLAKLHFVEVFTEFGFELTLLRCIKIYVKVIAWAGKSNFVVDCSGYPDSAYLRRVKDELHRRGVS